MNTQAAAGLHDEVRRLRMRITSLASSPHPDHSLDAVLPDGRTRRQAVREALADLAALSLATRPIRSSMLLVTAGAAAGVAAVGSAGCTAASGSPGRPSSSAPACPGGGGSAGIRGPARTGRSARPGSPVGAGGPVGAVPEVPDLGDRVLADQLVVLLLDCAPEYGAIDAVTEKAHALAVSLRRTLG